MITVFSNVVDLDWIRIQWGSWICIRIRIKEGKMTGSLDVFYGGLGISKLPYYLKKSFFRQYCWSGEVLFKFFQL
jgi:hypothetical protein